MCILYYLSDLGNTIQSATFTAIGPIMAQVYDMSPLYVNITTLLYIVILPTVTPLSTYVIDTYGMSQSVKIGVILSMIGAWPKLFMNDLIEVILIGTIFTALGGPFIFNAKTKLTANWFTLSSWPTVTIFITFGGITNTIVSVIVPSLWFYGYDLTFDQFDNYKQGKSLMQSLMWFYAITVTIFSIFTIFLLKDKPPTPASFTSTIERDNFKQATKTLILNKQYILLLFAASLIFGSFTGGLVVSISFYVKPFGFNTSDTMYLIGITLITGVIGSILAQYILQRYQNYKIYIMVSWLFQGLSILLLTLVMETGDIIHALIGMGFLGFFAIPAIPAVFEFACEISFPVGEGSALGYVQAFSALSAFVFGILFSVIVKGQNKMQSYYGMILVLSCFFTGVLIMAYLKQDLKRTKSEKLRKFVQNYQSIRSFQKNNESHSSSQISKQNSKQSGKSQIKSPSFDPSVKNKVKKNSKAIVKGLKGLQLSKIKMMIKSPPDNNVEINL